jgi:transcriptional regulator with XRE-family HTH domain
MNFDDYLKKKLEDPEFRHEWAADEEAFQIVRLLVSTRARLGLTQAQLAKRMGTDQASVSRAETTGQVTAAFLARFVQAIGGSAILTVRSPGSKVTRFDIGALLRDRPRPTGAPASVALKRELGQRLRRLRVKRDRLQQHDMPPAPPAPAARETQRAPEEPQAA